MRWLKKLLRSDAPPAPVLLRVTDAAGQSPLVLDITARWQPSGRRIERSVRTAHGLCVVHWLGEEESVELHVRGVECEGRLSVPRDRADQGRVRELPLARAATPTEVSPRLHASSVF